MDQADKLRIAFVTKEFITEDHFYGGLANYTYRTTKKLASLGHDVHVITCSEKDESTFDYDDIHVHRLKISPLPIWIRWLGQDNLEGSTGQRIYFNVKVCRKLYEIHKKTFLDIVQFTNVFASGLISVLFLPIPHVTRVSSYRPLWNRLDMRNQDWEHKLHEWLEWLQLCLSKHVYTPSYKMKEILTQEMKIKSVKVMRPPAYLETNGCWDSSVYDWLLKDKEYLLFFGRLQIRKGFHILAQVLPRFLSENPQAYAVCVGPDYKTRISSSMREYARSLCKDFAERLIFIDEKLHQQLYPIIAGAKVVILPSLMENLSNACIEAMLLGKPVIGTLGTSFEELITDGENGFLVPPGDPDSLAEKLKEVWNYIDLVSIGYAAQRTIRELAPENTTVELLNYFQTIIAT